MHITSYSGGLFWSFIGVWPWTSAHHKVLSWRHYWATSRCSYKSAAIASIIICPNNPSSLLSLPKWSFSQNTSWFFAPGRLEALLNMPPPKQAYCMFFYPSQHQSVKTMFICGCFVVCARVCTGAQTQAYRDSRDSWLLCFGESHIQECCSIFCVLQVVCVVWKRTLLVHEFTPFMPDWCRGFYCCVLASVCFSSCTFLLGVLRIQTAKFILYWLKLATSMGRLIGLPY